MLTGIWSELRFCPPCRRAAIERSDRFKIVNQVFFVSQYYLRNIAKDSGVTERICKVGSIVIVLIVDKNRHPLAERKNLF